MKQEHLRGFLPDQRMKSLSRHQSFSIFFSLCIALVVSTILCFRWNATSASQAFARSLSTPTSPFDFGNQTFELDHTMLHFTNGLYESSDRQHTASITDRHVNQSSTRAAAILIDNPPGSGIFSYVVGAIRTDGRVKYSQPVFLGDRIKIKAVSVGEGTVTVHYLTHPINASLAMEPTQAATVIYTFQNDGNLRAAQ